MKKFSAVKDLKESEKKEIIDLLSYSLIGEAKDHPISVQVDEEAIKRIEQMFNEKHIELLIELKTAILTTNNIMIIDQMIEKIKQTL